MCVLQLFSDRDDRVVDVHVAEAEKRRRHAFCRVGSRSDVLWRGVLSGRAAEAGCVADSRVRRAKAALVAMAGEGWSICLDLVYTCKQVRPQVDTGR